MAKKEKQLKKKGIHKLTIVMMVLNIIVAGCFFVTYGPIDILKTRVITTAMNTMSYQFVPYIFYSEKTIKDIMSKNFYVPVNESVNLDEIVIGAVKKDKYKDEYEKQIYEKIDTADYNVIPVQVKNNKGYLVAIYDPSKVTLIAKEQLGTANGERILDMCNRVGGAVCINGGGFVDVGNELNGTPLGYLVKNGKVIWSDGYRNWAPLIGFTSDDKLVLLNMAAEDAIKEYGLRDALEFGPFLIVNGKPMTIYGDGGFGRAPRVAIAQRRDGIVLFLVVDAVANYTDGVAIGDTIDILLKYGAYNAANLDGGHSTTLVVNRQLYNKPPGTTWMAGGRDVISGWGFIP